MSDNSNIHDEVAQSTMDNPLAQGAKGALGKASSKALSALKKSSKKAILYLIKLLIPYLGFVLGILLVFILAYFIIFEFVGTEKQYSYSYENEVKYDNYGRLISAESDVSVENRTIRDFYVYFSGQSIWQLRKGTTGENEDDFINIESDDRLEDYYKREDLFKLPPNLLFSLDRYMYNNDFKYPEQFIKRVYYDKDTFKTADLTDEDGSLIVESFKKDLDTGESTTEKITSISDYGFGSVLVYNEKEEYERTLYVEGRYNIKEVFNPETESIEYETIDEPFKLMMDGYPQEIDLIDKVLSFSGTLEYEYEYKDQKYGDLLAGVADINNENEPKKAYLYEIYVHEKCEMVEIEGKVLEEGEDEEDKYEEVCTYEDIPLKKYRSSDSMILENLPVVTNTNIDSIGDKYFKDYLYNFGAYIPKDTIDEDDIVKRIDYESYVFDIDSLIDEDYGFNLGSSKNSKSYEASIQYLDIVKNVSSEFGIDPHLIIAMIAQESGGNTFVNDGLMQITKAMGNSVTAKNVYGEIRTVEVDHDNKNNPELNILYGVMHFKSLLDEYGNNPYKALQAYNFGSTTLNRIKNINEAAWNSDFGWLYYREQAREEQRPGSMSANPGSCMAYPNQRMDSDAVYGDSCYVENVLRYYTGHDIEDKESSSLWENITTAGKNIWEIIFKNNDKEQEIRPVSEYKKNIHESLPDDIIRTHKALDNQEYFSEVELGELSFFDEGFFDAVGNIGISLYEILQSAPNKDGYISPISFDGSTRISSKFGYRIHPIQKISKLHTGVDIAAPQGTKVYAVAEGVVVKAEYHDVLGYYITIDHGNGAVTRNLHLSAFTVGVGDRVEQGRVIGLVGSTGSSTGPHLHFEMKINDKYIDPLAIVLGD